MLFFKGFLLLLFKFSNMFQFFVGIISISIYKIYEENWLWLDT